jgi:Glycosyl transferase family 2
VWPTSKTRLTEPEAEPSVAIPRSRSVPRATLPLFFYGTLLGLFGLACYFCGIAFSVVRLTLHLGQPFRTWNEAVVWYSGVPTTAGLVLAALDLALLLPGKRKRLRREPAEPVRDRHVVVGLTAYNDEQSIQDAVIDFLSHSLVRRVIAVDNNSTDNTFAAAHAAGGLAITEARQAYGHCVYRCFQEALSQTDAELIVLCEGDLTFRARDLDKLLAYIDHADIVNGTRIVEQLRDYSTQLSTFIYYGNFFAGKLLELKHLGRGTFTDVGTTYKLVRRSSLERLLPLLNPDVNLEFNAHFLDTALAVGERIVECPITFHPRVGASKGGNMNDIRALQVGLRMIWGFCFGWRRRHG